MSDPNDKTSSGPALPSMGKPGRPSKSDLDEREQQLAEREQQLAMREANASAEFEKLPPRQSIDENVPRKEGGNPKAERRSIGHTKRLNADLYLELYQDKQLLWVNDLSGDVQRWIDEGAEPVPVQRRNSRTFEGITDVVDSKWVRAIGGDDGMGGHFWVYLLMIDPQVYHAVKIAPEQERQNAIRRAMLAGGDKSGDVTEKGFKPYQPYLPSGKTGVEISQETVR